MADLPTGTVTFLFTDVQSSTKLAQAPSDTWHAARQRHDAFHRQGIETHHNYIVQLIGGVFCVSLAIAHLLLSHP